MPAALTLAAAAKVNLSLHVVGRRTDGYHELDSLIGFTDVTDVLTLRDAAEIQLTISGPESETIECDDRNLVVQAARLVQAHLGVSTGVDMVLEKNIPVAAGLGGGSADAAAAVSGCLALWGTSDSDTLSDDILASKLGADVPICRYGRAAQISGIGETVTPALHWPSAWLVLVNPRVPLSTASVFKHFDGPLGSAGPQNFKGRDYAAFITFLSGLENSLTAPATDLAPIIRDVLTEIAALPKCDLARMSGSGPTCFGLFDSLEAAVAASQALAYARPEWWVKPSTLQIKSPG
jgi:4-diphosphocytidyl-2-C-methyl-D-erythritol kinase